MRVMYVLLTMQPHTILQDERYFLDLALTNVNVSIIFCIASLIEGFGRVNIMLPNGTSFHINDASFKDIRRNGYHIETMNESKIHNVFTVRLLFLARNL